MTQQSILVQYPNLEVGKIYYDVNPVHGIAIGLKFVKHEDYSVAFEHVSGKNVYNKQLDGLIWFTDAMDLYLKLD